jgi:membrane associated rhomboid family serine protease
MFPIRDNIPSRGVPVVTWGLIVINALVFLFELSLPRHQLEIFFYKFGLVPARITELNWSDPAQIKEGLWPFLTMMFVHGGWIHIIGNMWSLFLFGDNVEDRIGSARFLIFYLLCGFAAGVVQYWMSPNSETPSIGASGAIAGVMGAYLILFPYARIITLIPILFFPFIVEVPAVIFLGFWYITQIVSGLSVHSGVAYEQVAWWAHVGGFTAGILLLAVFLPRRVQYRRPYPDEYHPW